MGYLDAYVSQSVQETKPILVVARRTKPKRHATDEIAAIVSSTVRGPSLLLAHLAFQRIFEKMRE